MGDIVPFPKRPVIFSEGARSRIAPKLTDLTTSPDVVLDRVEDAMCAELVLVTREFASAAAEKLGHWLTETVFGGKPRRA